MSRQILAVDIRGDCIAAVLLNTGLKSSLVQAGLTIPLESGSVDSEQLVAALKELVQQMQASNANVVVSIPVDNVIFRTLNVPFSDEKKIRQILPFELEPVLPQTIENLTIDFLPGQNGTQNDILTVAVDQQVLDAYLSSLEAAQIRPQLVVPGAFPLVISIIAHMPELPKQTVFIDVGKQKSTLFLIESGYTALVRTFPTELGSQSAAETMATKVRQTITSFIDTKANDFSPAVVLLSGSGLADSSVYQRLSACLELPTELIDIRSKLPKIEVDGQLEQWRPVFMDNALTLGIIEAEGRSCPNFHRSSSPFRNYWNAYRSYIRGPAVLLSLVLLLWMGGVLVDSHLLNNRIEQIDLQLEELFKTVLPDKRRVGDPLDQIQSEIKNLKNSGISGGLDINKARSVDILFQVSKSIPKEMEVVFDRVVIGENEVTISAETASFKIVDDIKMRLEQSDMFKQVTIASANMDKSGKKVRFKLTIGL
jgi:type II secretion system protein L